MMQTVLLVEDEAVLRSTVKRSLAKIPGIEIVDAGLLSQARALARVEKPDLLLSDLSLPDGTALELLADMDRQGVNIPVIFMTAYLGAFKDRIPERRGLEIHEKPVPLELLKKRVLARLRPHSGPVATSNISPFSVAEYLQLAAMGRHSVVIRLLRNGRTFGRVDLVNGELWSARAMGDTGIKAIYRLAFATGFEISVAQLIGEPGERNLQIDLHHALLDAARIQDEALREGRPPPILAPEPRPPAMPGTPMRAAPPPLPTIVGRTRHAPRQPERTSSWSVRERSQSLTPAPASAPMPPLPTPVERTLSRSQRLFANCMDEGLDSLLARDYHMAFLAFSEALAIDPESAIAQANLNRIREMGKAP